MQFKLTLKFFYVSPVLQPSSLKCCTLLNLSIAFFLISLRYLTLRYGEPLLHLAKPSNQLQALSFSCLGITKLRTNLGFKGVNQLITSFIAFSSSHAPV